MELLSPAGNIKKLKYAINYGADAVYTAGRKFGLRAKCLNLSYEELKEAVNFCHHNVKKIYITVNIFAHNSDLEKIPSYLKFLQKIKVDAVIVSDPGVLELVKEHTPELPIHVSTQANITSWKSAEFWFKQGAKRIILARELTISEIRRIREKVPGIELEMFIHGAMCMSYSGRCLLSSFLNNRSANRGYCTQPCRWEYHLIEQTRPGEYFQIEEDKYGSYILNSKDLCLIDRLSEIMEAGINSVKIEGRMKSLYYVANVTRTYK
ncbi:MAG: U32 family peptidase, partial [Candidatus Cloacimonetes bacterium]|nr:U32 family peptidase [Candidatus Cloacimonadota bacterium]